MRSLPSESGERKAQLYRLTLCSGFQYLTLCSLLTCGAERGEFGDAENGGVGGEEKSAVAAAGFRFMFIYFVE
jgi:hypothetical protein